MPVIDAPKGGINRRLPAYNSEMLKRSQCVTLQNLKFKDELIIPITGFRKYHGTSLGSTPVTAIMPYYNDQTDQYLLLAACGGSIYKRDEATNEFTTLVSALTPNSIFSSVIRHGVLYIASTNDDLKQYTGGNTLDTVGGGATKAGSFRYIVYMKEVDRLFGISDNAIFGQISWCDLSQPEIWDGASVERLKLRDGERTEGGSYLYGKLIIFNTYSIWIYYVSGNEENWKLEEAPTSVGCVAPNTIKKDGQRILFLGEAPGRALGIYAFNGSSCTLLTDDITPLLKTANKNKLRNACAEIHDDVYTFSIALGGSEVNNFSFDLDLFNNKEDGTPAIYGPHTFAFSSSAVLNNRHKNKEWLIGDESDGFIYYESGNTFKSTDGNDGSVIEQIFTSMIHNEDEVDMLRQYTDIGVFFKPTTFHDVIVKAYLSYGTFAEEHTMRPAVVSEGFAGEFDIYDQRNLGIPEFYEYKQYLEMSARGTALQLELINRNLGKRLIFSKYRYNFSKIYQTQKVQAYSE